MNTLPKLAVFTRTTCLHVRAVVHMCVCVYVQVDCLACSWFVSCEVCGDHDFVGFALFAFSTLHLRARAHHQIRKTLPGSLKLEYRTLR